MISQQKEPDVDTDINVCDEVQFYSSLSQKHFRWGL